MPEGDVRRNVKGLGTWFHFGLLIQIPASSSESRSASGRVGKWMRRGRGQGGSSAVATISHDHAMLCCDAQCGLQLEGVPSNMFMKRYTA